VRWEDRVLGAVLGQAVGDALGVPVEFKSRESLKANLVTDMRGFGTHNQPPGTWSDDASLMLCLLESLAEGLDLKALGKKFIAWREDGYWTPHGKVFDIGNATSDAIDQLIDGVPPLEAGGADEYSNGNGSLMRILPVAFIKDLTDEEAIRLAEQVSRLTHRHPRSQMACGLFVLMSRRLLEGVSPAEAHKSAIASGPNLYDRDPFSAELPHFNKFLSPTLANLEESDIQSSGYVIHTLEAATWCLLTTSSYSEAVLKAVNLGRDTDTTAVVVGGLAGLAYGNEAIPGEWLEALDKKKAIDELVEAFIKTAREDNDDSPSQKIPRRP
jgi:ADP-ribosyl-[dinitrogen reductase] hydrolase